MSGVSIETQSETLVDTRSLIFWLGAFDFFAAMGVEGIVNELARRNHSFTFFWTTFMKEPRPEDAIAHADACFEIKRFRVRNLARVAVGVFPFAVRAGIACCE